MNKIFKAITFSVLAGLLALNLSLPINAADPSIKAKVVFDDKVYSPGKSVALSVKLTGTKVTDKTNSIGFDIEYDGNTFELETGSAEKDIKDEYMKFTTKYDVGTGSDKRISVMYINMSENTTLKEDKNVVTVKFKVKKDASEGTKVFKLRPVKMFDTDFNSYPVNDGKAYTTAIEIGTTAHTKVVVNGKPVTFDVYPQIVKGRTLVPVRKIFEALGATVDWDAATRTITGTKGNTKVILKIDSTDALVNDVQKTLDVPATIIDGRTLVPTRFISESLGANVDWDGDTGTIIIVSE